MKYIEIYECYETNWENISELIRLSSLVILKNKRDRTVLDKWYSTYFSMNQTRDRQTIMSYQGKDILGIYWSIDKDKTACIEQVLSKIKINHPARMLSFIELVAKKMFIKKIKIKQTDIEESWLFPLKSFGYIEVEGYLVKTLSYRTGLVLSGGGAKGAYQIGVWKALKETEIATPIVTGTSVGALNGALILQNDLAMAERMWEEIETKKIVSFPTKEDMGLNSLNQVLDEMQVFFKTAVENKGVSTEPLRKLVTEILSIEALLKSPSELFICTTQAKNLNEVVVNLKNSPREQLIDWLIASSSFFPAMSATKINDDNYIDGGYRNNIPVDVAINEKVTELIIVDIMGPGVTKKINIPENISVSMLKTRWPLGAVLLFNGRRSKWNIELGYLEAKKMLGDYSGKLYTFSVEKDPQKIKKANRRLAKKVFTTEQVSYINQTHLNEIYKKIRRLTHDRVSLHTWMINLLELLAKNLGVSPVELYSIDEFIPEIVSQYQKRYKQKSENQDFQASMLFSYGEWVMKYLEKAPIISEESQLLLLTNYLTKGNLSFENWKRLFSVHPTLLIMAQMLHLFIKESETIENGTRI